MVMMSGKVRVVTKTKEVIEGVIMPKEDIESLIEMVPLYSVMGLNSETGFFIFREDEEKEESKITYVDRDEVKSMKCLRFA